ncbi:MAG: hypothetical protein OHK0041_06500 [Anaerolineales bacterium]
MLQIDKLIQHNVPRDLSCPSVRQNIGCDMNVAPQAPAYPAFRVAYSAFRVAYSAFSNAEGTLENVLYA